MTPTLTTPTLTITPARRKLAATKENEIHVALTIKTPQLDQTAKRQPLAIAVALDISSSMNESTDVRLSSLGQLPEGFETLLASSFRHRHYGDSFASKIDCAKLTLLRLIDNLGPEDTLTLVTFGYHASTVASNIPMIESGKARARQMVTEVTAYGNTALADGLYTALRSLRSISDGRTRRVMLLTDGEANVGERSARGMLQYIGRDETDGIAVSTFGLGTSYNSELLTALARNGGSHYYLKDGEMIATSFGTELGTLTSLFAEKVQLAVRFGEHVQLIDVLNDLTVSYVGGSKEGTRAIDIECDDLVAGQTYNVVLKVRTKKHSRALKTPVALLSADLSYTDAKKRGVTQTGITSGATIELTTVKTSDKADDAEVVKAVAVQEAARAQREADAAAERGDIDGARATLLRNAFYLSNVGELELGAAVQASADVGYASMSSYRSVGNKMAKSFSTTLKRQTASTGGQKLGGVDVDGLFANEQQKQMSNAFSIVKAATPADDMPDVDSMLTSK